MTGIQYVFFMLRMRKTIKIQKIVLYSNSYYRPIIKLLNNFKKN